MSNGEMTEHKNREYNCGELSTGAWNDL